jgi:hypothetical protein
MVDLRISAAAALLLAAVPALAAPPSGRSDLGFSFAAVGGDNWCAREVRVRLDADLTDAYADLRALSISMGRLRAGISAPDECPDVEVIALDAHVGGLPYMTGEMARFARWIVVWNDPATGLPKCLAGPPDADCAPHARAYEAARLVHRDEPGELIHFLDPHREGLAEWRSGSFVGTMRHVPYDALRPGTTARDVARDLEFLQARECAARGSSMQQRSIDDELSDRARLRFGCGAEEEAVIVAGDETGFMLIGLRSGDGDPDDFDAYSLRVLQTLRGMPNF